VCLEVADTGAGMTPEVVARIYEPFFTTKGPDRGTGLGLAVVHGIVEQHGGWIECESAPGRGTTFRVHLPAVDAEAPDAAAADAPVRGRGETVLVADDQEAVRGLVRTVLERCGFRVLLARDGAEAVEVFRREQGRIRVVVLDRTMPQLSGPEALRALRAIAPAVGVIMTSGYDADPGELAADAVDAFLSKPYPPHVLGRVVRQVLDSRR
jgi:CheY-like chemotaxis protein